MYDLKDVVWEGNINWILKTKDYYELYRKDINLSNRFGFVGFHRAVEDIVRIYKLK